MTHRVTTIAITHVNTQWSEWNTHCCRPKQRTYFINLTGLREIVVPFFLEVVQETAISHEWHDNRHSWASIKTHTEQRHHIGMLKVLHLYNFCHQTFNVSCRKQPYDWAITTCEKLCRRWKLWYVSGERAKDSEVMHRTDTLEIIIPLNVFTATFRGSHRPWKLTNWALYTTPNSPTSRISHP